jgi:photosystem II stability/assembly factor-like uncharacterized protein
MRLFVSFPIFCYIFLFFYSFSNASASTEMATQPATKAVLAAKSLLLGIAPIGDKKLVAVGQHGHILLSDNGDTWQQASVPSRTTLTNVYFFNEQLGWAVGHDASIFHSNDGGLTWQTQQLLPAEENPLLDIYFKNPTQGIAVGAYGKFYRTNDGGKTWENEFHQEFLLADDVDYINDLKAEDEEAYQNEIAFILPHFNGIVSDGNTLFLFGETGLLAKSTDFGVNWQSFDSFYQGSFFSLATSLTGSQLVAGLRGHVFRLHNDGQQWQEVITGTSALLNDIIVGPDNTIYIIGNNGMLLISTDDGKSFSKHTQKDGKTLIAGQWFNGRLIAVSDVGVKVIQLPQR